MAGKRLVVMDVREVLRQLRMGQSVRAISRRMGISRNTITKYKSWAVVKGLLDGDMPDMGTLDELVRQLDKPKGITSEISLVEPYRECVEGLVAQKVQMTTILDRIQERGFEGSYSSLRRFVGHLEAQRLPEAFVRIETQPGEQCQIDFGYAGLMLDPVTKKLRKTYVFSAVLSYSRYPFAKLVFDQSIETWITLHIEAFEYFGGVPREVVIDNTRSGIARAAIYDPVVQRTYREFAEYYGFLVDPCKPGLARHKGKTESGVKFVKRRFLAGQTFRDINEGNEKLKKWLEKISCRIHGTTRRMPLEVFQQQERKALKPLPEVAYELCAWKQVKLHPDCKVVFEGSYYSAPYRLIGKKLWLKATTRQVQLYHEYELVAVHCRVRSKGEWQVLQEHLPPEKVAYLMQTPRWCRERAQQIGPWTERFVERLLNDRPLNRLRAVQGVLRLTQKYGGQRLEAACQRALRYEEMSYRAIRNILEKELDRHKLAEQAQQRCMQGTFRFARDWSEFFSEGQAKESKVASI